MLGIIILISVELSLQLDYSFDLHTGELRTVTPIF